MSTAIQATDKLKLRLYCYNTNTAQLGITNLWYFPQLLVGTVLDTECLAALDNALGGFQANMMPALTGLSYTGAGLSIYSNLNWKATTAEVTRTANAQAGKGPGTEVLPNQVAMLISLRTGLAGPAGRGRIYPPFIDATYTDAQGRMTAAGETALQLYAAKLQTQIPVTGAAGSANLQLILRHRVVGPPKSATYQVIATCAGVQKFATQRRRGQFGRINVSRP